jgi:heterodisulfide reductase subunit A
LPVCPSAQALPDNTLPINKDVLVLGGGVSGMNAALELADHGHRVYLAEQAGHLGGIARAVRKTLEGDDVQAYMTDLIEKVSARTHRSHLPGDSG